MSNDKFLYVYIILIYEKVVLNIYSI